MRREARPGAARVDRVQPDPSAAATSIGQARKHLASARIPGLDGESRYLLVYQAVLKATAGALAAAGCRVTEGRGAHMLYLREARRLLGPRCADLLDRLDRARRTRHRVAYGWEEVSGYELEVVERDTANLIEAAAAYVEEASGRT